MDRIKAEGRDQLVGGIEVGSFCPIIRIDVYSKRRHIGGVFRLS
jgi:hypothetical protein